jgi:hypothetical protein
MSSSDLSGRGPPRRELGDDVTAAKRRTVGEDRVGARGAGLIDKVVEDYCDVCQYEIKMGDDESADIQEKP